MSIGLPVTHVLMLSGILNDQGLQIPADLESRIASFKYSTQLTGKLSIVAQHPYTSSTVLAALQNSIPGLSGVIPSTVTDTIPVGIDQHDVIGSIHNRAQAIVGNGLVGLLEAIGIANGAMTLNYGVHASAEAYKQQSYDAIQIGATGYTDIVTHGLTSSFGPLAVGTPAQVGFSSSNRTPTIEEVSRSLSGLAAGLRKLGRLYDLKDFASIGHAYGLVRQLAKAGLYWNTNLHNLMTNNGYDVNTITEADDLAMTQLLQRITGDDLTRIINTVGLTPPDVNLINTAADLLIANKVLPGDAAAAIPHGDLTRLGEKLTTLGVNPSNIEAFSHTLDTVTIPDTANLNTLLTPLPDNQYLNLKAQLPSGDGLFGNPTIDDILGSVTGQAYQTDIDILNTSALNASLTTKGQTLGTALDNYITVLATAATPNSTLENALIAAINDLVKENASSSVTNSNSAIIRIVARAVREFNNCNKVGLRFTPNVRVYSTGTVFDSFYANAYISAHYNLTVTNGYNRENLDVLVVHNSASVATAKLIGNVFAGNSGPSSLGSVSASITSGLVNVVYTAYGQTQAPFYLKLKTPEYTTAHDGLDPTTLTGPSTAIATVTRLDELARDPNFLNVGNLIARMSTPDVAGDSVRAAVAQGVNTLVTNRVGIYTKAADPDQLAQNIVRSSGLGLTDAQIAIVKDYATKTSQNIGLALSTAAQYGFNSAFYQKLGYDVPT